MELKSATLLFLAQDYTERLSAGKTGKLDYTWLTATGIYCTTRNVPAETAKALTGLGPIQRIVKHYQTKEFSMFLFAMTSS